MLKALSSVLLLVILGVINCVGQHDVELEIVRQLQVETESSDLFLENKGVLFRITNNSKSTIFLRGRNVDDKFLIQSFLIRHEEGLGWVARDGKTKLPTFGDYPALGEDRLGLRPGQSFEFIDVTGTAHAGKRHLGYIFFHRKDDIKPVKVESQEFTLDTIPVKIGDNENRNPTKRQ